MPSNRKIYWALFTLLVLSALIRGFIAGFIELGNDEVYYWTYAKFPALSHFDHPPMVGFMIQLFTLNLTFEDEFFIRLSAIVLGTMSTGLMFLIGRHIKNPLTGLYAALLFTASLYGFILSGTFILPDAPQVFFWLLTMYFLLKSLADRDLMPKSRYLLLLAGFTAGMALLSKYHSVFLLTGVFCYMLFHHRRWFRVKETYLAALIFVLLCMPVVLWNFENKFISFTYHENRISITASGLKPQYFLTEIVGEFFYNNPVNVIIILTAMVALIRRRQFIRADYKRIILWISLPLVLVFLSFSLFRSTLPHWTGPGYLGFIMIAAAYLSEPKHPDSRMRLFPWPVSLSLGFLMIVAVAAIGQIRYGWVPLSKWKLQDVSHDMTGWKQLGEKFAPLAKVDEEQSLMKKSSPILTFRWFPAANLDYYVGTKINKPVYAIGSLERIHKYHWINQLRGNLNPGTNAYYIALSDDYEDPLSLYGNLFETILPADTLYIMRGNDTVRKAFVYRMISLKKKMVFN
ncbi:MAG: glycosyltransferase family 39 protein [Bacteroidetes bacterium]|nr:glycosyltransferase family 39 protein [Bacteroidota bacterium]